MNNALDVIANLVHKHGITKEDNALRELRNTFERNAIAIAALNTALANLGNKEKSGEFINEALRLLHGDGPTDQQFLFYQSNPDIRNAVKIIDGLFTHDLYKPEVRSAWSSIVTELAKQFIKVIR